MGHDMKQGLQSAKPRPSLIGKRAATYLVRAHEYGDAKYYRGNFHNHAPKNVQPVERYLGYLDAALRHIMAITHELNVTIGAGGDIRAACAVVDSDSSGSFPPSMLPHIAHALASLAIAVEVGVNDGLLPEDPGMPWVEAMQ